MTTFSFSTTSFSVNGWTIARVPDDISKLLPSRGQVAVTGTINQQEFRTVLEPDGNWGHWVHIPEKLKKTLGISNNDTIDFELNVTKEWPEPIIPEDFASDLKRAPVIVHTKWQNITPMARWEWVRWINSTGNPDTRAVRIEKSISKLSGKHRRPCCFNLAACTIPEVSKNGVLIQLSDGN